MSRNRRPTRYVVPFNGENVEVDYRALRTIKESLTFQEVQRLIEACDTITEKALVELAVSTGIRRNDIVKIEINRIDFKENKLIFWEEKKDRLWIVALCPELLQTLKMYIATLPRDQRYLFVFSGRTAYNIVQKLISKARINKHIPFHALRRTFIRLSKRMGRDIRFVMDQTGDTARVIIEEYEGYTIDEMTEMMKEDNILRRAKHSTELENRGLSALWKRRDATETSLEKMTIDHLYNLENG
jgi:integrase/recombinase XerD